MKTKTCGECRFFVTNPAHGGCCTFICDAMCDDDRACDSFEKPTNGDQIRQKSNEEFARDYVHYHSKFKVYVARLCPLNKQLWTTREEAEKANLDWLNAPAGKDNNVPAKESEGEDE